MKYQLQLKNICKSYGSLKANHKVSLKIKPASIHALLGENGAGKSTLVNIIYGLVARDSGKICWQDKPVEINSPVMAREIGIGVVFQHFALFNSLRVVDNIALGISYKGSIKKLGQHILETSRHYKLEVNPYAIIAELSTGEKQRVEIIRCLLQKPKLLILDEPTSVLTPVETNNLFITLRKLQQDGCSILFIGHKLDEIKQICEVATILRHGEFVSECDLVTTEVSQLAQMMIGSRINEYAGRNYSLTSKVVLQLSSTGEKNPKNSSSFHVDNLELKSGKITGIAGIAGNGQDQLMSFLSGEVINNSHSIKYNNQDISNWSVHMRNEAGILFVPTERLGRSAVTQMNLVENALLGIAKRGKFINKQLINYNKLANFSSQIIDKFNVKVPNNIALALSLSGGNLQKFIVGRAILQDPKILLISNPTWGVDISAAIFIRNSILQLRDSGAAILVASEDLDEMFTICDEIAVIKEAKLGAVERVANLTIDEVGLMMTE